MDAVYDNSRVNGIHDMGGMDGFGRMRIEADEPVFHHEWERRLFAISMSLTGSSSSIVGNVDEFRHAIERIPPERYLADSYYERWLDAVQTLLIEKGIVTRDELIARGADPVTPVQPPGRFKRKVSSKATRARFGEGDRVVARNINPPGHTRLPRYVRGKRGVIRRDWGVYIFADSNAHHAGTHHQHVYCVEFDARELWGASAPPRDTLRIDLWEDYLEPDSAGRKPARKPVAKKKPGSTKRRGTKATSRKKRSKR